MSWEDDVEGIRERRERAKEHGGAEAVGKQHARGRLTIRERIEEVCDAESFREQGPIAGHGERAADGTLESFTPANYVLGLATLDGRPCVVGGEDFTQRGGSPSPAGLRKSVYAETLAVRMRLPLIRLLEGGGGSVTGSRGKGAPRPMGDPVYAPPRFQSVMQAMATAPVASAALGAVAGLPAARLVASHFSVMTRETSQVIIGGPALVERATGEKLTKDELGGAKVHARSGVVDNVAKDEADALAQVKRFLSYLPTNVDGLPPVCDCDDPVDRCEDGLLRVIPAERRRVYDSRKLIRAVVDRDSFFEMTAGYGRSQVTGFARLDGQPVGIWANDCRFYAGAMTANAAQKVRRFVDLCDTFHLPVVAFVDEPGFMIGSEAERTATIRHGAAAIFAVQQSQVPWASVMVRKAYGVAAAAHFGPESLVLAWPSAESGALPIEGGVAVAFRREIEQADDPDALRAELEEKLAGRRDPFARAESFGVHDLIDPRETRPRLCDWLRWNRPLLEALRGPRSYSIRP
ncbi:MAG: carboxyl transferase domain-containing protein [Myxococcota bacterium]|nr:carboxyl transferase domain-containing protein [Myxococcota bacterium]